ncbi:MAG: hypothetical protein K2Q18_10810, partial [Bdellovibrionales bacterium]|nr:hypothetical protein [Bdellovibrionales bacterium]
AQFCNGSKLVNMNSQMFMGGGGACTTNFMIKYFNSNMRICVGGSWYATGYCSSCGGMQMHLCSGYGGHIAACQADLQCEWDSANGICKDVPTNGGGGGGGGSSI